MQNWFVYILKSEKDRKTYCGSTNDLTRRIDQHNKGYVKSTKNRRPLTIFYKEEYNTEADARKRERYFKSASGRKFLAKLF